MKEIKLIIDGKEVAALTKEQIEALGIDVDVDEGCVCDRSKIDKSYFHVNSFCSVSEDKEMCCDFDNKYYNIGNYYQDEAYAKQVALHQQLNNLLRRYSEQNGGDCEWDCNNTHYGICFAVCSNKFYVTYDCTLKFCGVVYFSSPMIAEKAIEEVVKPFIAEHPDFVW